MENLKGNPNSHLTAKERDNLSFPAKILFERKFLHGRILDFGCGFGNDVKILSAKGLDIKGYDKHYFPNYPSEKFDTIICFYVLNVLLPEEQSTVLMELSRLIKPTGKVYITVRRDIKFEGFRTHKMHQKKTYQCNVILHSKSVFRNENCEIYEYQHYNQLPKISDNHCPFCYPDSDRELVVESATAYAIYDKFPVSEGHALVIPKRHCADYFELSFKEQSACMFLLSKVKEIISSDYHPDGFNVGINIGEFGGQTVDHVHIHLIPRYKGDVANPRGGVRGVIPSKKEY
ncbi:bifunctional class I SAM-dependent methyltransferase/HIT family protein [Kaistella faecalis]|uniref:bifunctional class I SAM-dependent methyltransferase/HIT family protein n=1 Tax=Kaistella faecalis TaxID=2852098 RepID=UPI001C46217D|nr:bifunctional class I SAM-dependent methyltransferase/HIT family protein [Chryseobacterium faecale]UFK97737.1 HIT domain-containing protein [Chryseobacterium faecale]